MMRIKFCASAPQPTHVLPFHPKSSRVFFTPPPHPCPPPPLPRSTSIQARADTSSAVPWRKARPSPPSPGGSGGDNNANQSHKNEDSLSPPLHSTTSTTTAKTTAKDLIGYVAVLDDHAHARYQHRSGSGMIDRHYYKKKQKGAPIIGRVTQILSTAESGTGYPLLRIVDTDDSTNDTNDTSTIRPPQIEHVVPFVRGIVPRIDPVHKRIFIDPPDGLLELGLRRSVLHYLKRELIAFIDSSSSSSPTSTENETITSRRMPMRRELEAAGRRDLVKLVVDAGGFIEIAQEFGFQSVRRPAGYWGDQDALDRELSLFVAANWVRFEEDVEEHVLQSATSADVDVSLSSSDDDDDDDVYDHNEDDDDEDEEKKNNTVQTKQTRSSKEIYWYNQVTRKVRWTEPILPRVMALDDQGSTLLTEDPEDRVMPSRSSLLAAGRYDLHNAIVGNGGYVGVGKELGRCPAWPPTRHLHDSIRALAVELKEAVKDLDVNVMERVGVRVPRNERWMPTRQELESIGRVDLCGAVARHGGYARVAQRMGWKSRRLGPGAWREVGWVASECVSFALAQRKMNTTDNSCMQGDEVKGEEEEMYMPTHEELRSAGRHDLRHALQKLGSGVVAEVAGLKVRRRQGISRKNVKKR